MKRFYMRRHYDVNKKSGTGVVAEGIVFDDGTGAFTWLTKMKTVTTFWKVDDLKKLHGHNGCTEVIIEGPNNSEKFNACVMEAKSIKAEARLAKRKNEERG